MQAMLFGPTWSSRLIARLTVGSVVFIAAGWFFAPPCPAAPPPRPKSLPASTAGKAPRDKPAPSDASAADKTSATKEAGGQTGVAKKPPSSSGKSTTARPAPSDAEAKTTSSGAPADFTSEHFLLHTDLSPKDARELLERLETMVGIISKYWNKPPNGVIECYVVKNLASWPKGVPDEYGQRKIEQGAGVTITSTLSQGGQTVAAKSTVYAVADRGTPQHEAVHAYCGQTFGTCGPLWYSEGMAEVGQYWRKADSSVQIHPVVLDYIKSTPPKSLNAIVNSKSEATGDSWENYAWRWALCHLLANNPNYSARFQPLGLGFLHKQQVSFEDTYGAMADEISFEYLFFLKHIEQGFRVDLCAWDWKRKYKPLTKDASVSVKVAAARGWQSTNVQVTAGQKIEFSTTGGWQLGPKTTELSAAGDAAGHGRLEAVVFHDFQLTEALPLGASGVFAAPVDGKLMLRCADGWGELADNKGAVTVKLKAVGKDTPVTVEMAKPGPTDATASSKNRGPDRLGIAAPAPSDTN